MNYCESTSSFQRVRTREVSIGSRVIGNLNPILIQSMTNTDTENVRKTVEQILQLEQAGCDIVRVTVQSIKVAEKLEDIVNRLRQKKCIIPIVADIHFTPNAALKAVEFVEKIRINPGNYADKKKFEVIDYSDDTYAKELERIEGKFTPLLLKMKKYNRTMRIGTNHGSLSDRIMNRYGDTPLGMVESAWEFVKICHKNNFFNLVFSMKASNPQVMIQAYRLLQQRMYEKSSIYPLHLGVTEAGDGEDGRIKSFIGIGALLDDGLGDTIRVSLTEAPIKEIPVARRLADYYNKKRKETEQIILNETRHFASYQRRESISVLSIGEGQTPPVFIEIMEPLTNLSQEKLNLYKHIDLKTGVAADKYIFRIEIEEDVRCYQNLISEKSIDARQIVLRFGDVNLKEKISSEPFAYLLECALDKKYSFETKRPIIWELDIKTVNRETQNELLNFSFGRKDILTIKSGTVQKYRLLASVVKNNPILISTSSFYSSIEELTLTFSTLSGSLFCDGIGDGIILCANYGPLEQIKLAFTILQGTRQRISKTEYISCPSCGRTLFDLEEITAKIKNRTSHLKGVKIAIMGCIVNGPGEMADADFGYVGSGPGKINLYVGKNVVKRNIVSENAVEELVKLIKEHDMWQEEKK